MNCYLHLQIAICIYLQGFMKINLSSMHSENPQKAVDELCKTQGKKNSVDLSERFSNTREVTLFW